MPTFMPTTHLISAAHLMLGPSSRFAVFKLFSGLGGELRYCLFGTLDLKPSP